MNLIVPVKLVPDLVEELEITEDGASLDTTFMRLILNELDEHALEQAILLKERLGGEVVVLAPDVEDAEDVLYSAAAKGADRLIRLTGAIDLNTTNHALARGLASILPSLSPDLVLVGVQAHNDLDGSLGPLLAGLLDLPYTGYVAGVTVEDGHCVARKEYPGGLVAEMELALPAVLGIQAAEEPPRYVAISRIRQAMKTAEIEAIAIEGAQTGGGPASIRLRHPEVAERATMFEGDEEEIAVKLIELLREKGIL
jgi:electron transfer flavoprotein beta subunit